MTTMRSPWRRRFVVGLGVLFALMILSGCGGGDTPMRMQAGVELPEFTLPALDGTSVSSATFGRDGDVTVLNFWATWCQPCLKELPELKAVAANPRVSVVGVALDEEGAASVGPFVARHGVRYRVLLGNQKIFQHLGGIGIPYTLVLDADRKVVSVYRGPATGEQLNRDVTVAVAAADGSKDVRVASHHP
ncbi:MAG: TlpA disulfide reductase family protein [Acidobacteriota bacterium]